MCDSVGQCEEPDIYGFFVEFTEKEDRMLSRWWHPLGIPPRERVLRVLKRTRGEKAVLEGLQKGSFPRVA